MASTNFSRSPVSNNPARYISVGFAFILIVVVPAAAGFLLDKVLGTLPIFLLVGLGLGLVGGFYYVYLEMKKLGGG